MKQTEALNKPSPSASDEKKLAALEAAHLKLHADECEDLAVEVSHLTPVFQRFWQRSGNFSPRSRRLSSVVPKPRNTAEVTIIKLGQVRENVANAIENSRKVQEITSTFLVRHFEMVPSNKLSESIYAIFDSFDYDHDGFLNCIELEAAFCSMGRKLSDEDLACILSEYDADGNRQFDVVSHCFTVLPKCLHNFENGGPHFIGVRPNL
mmetsp:Transcript_32979/g.87515  ORF Transcript_32979/g.87515 Transcript_32979/m.87515 type:complete len:208 (+) Transcript_32979:93-716(+)